MSGGAAPKRKGTRAENIVREALRVADFLVMRSYSSAAPTLKDGVTAGYDLLAIDPQGRVYLIEVKTGSGRMSPTERKRLVEVATFYGAHPLMAYYGQGNITWKYIRTDGEYAQWEM